MYKYFTSNGHQDHVLCKPSSTGKEKRKLNVTFMNISREPVVKLTCLVFIYWYNYVGM